MRPIIDTISTGRNIRRLRLKQDITVRDIQEYLDLDTPRSVYKWQSGECLPSIENLLGLSILLKVPINDILKTA